MTASSVPILPPVTLGTGSQSVAAVARCKDNGGNSFVARLVVPGNDGYVEVFKRTGSGPFQKIDEFTMGIGPWSDPPSGQPHEHTRKPVDVDIMVDGPNVVSTVSGYNLTAPERDHYQEEYITLNVAVPFPQGVDPASGSGPVMYYEPANGSGGGGGGEVDPAVIERVVRAVLGVDDEMTFMELLILAISGRRDGSIRQGLEDKTKDAMAELFNDPPQMPIERVFQDRFFPYIKNANAGVQSNIIFGQDKWGREHRAGLVQIAHEGSHAVSDVAKVEGTEGIDGSGPIEYKEP